MTGPLGLNKNSTHPNPWRPPSLYDEHFFTYQTVRIFRGEQNMAKVAAPNFFTDEPFFELCKRVAWKSFVIGSGVAASDIVVVNQIKDNKARLARYLFVTSPFVAMGLGYVGTRHCLNSMFAEEGEDAAWTYPVAAVAPASIWGIFRNDVVRGCRAGLFMSLTAALYKYNHECGGLYFDQERFFPSKPVSQFDSKLGARSVRGSLEGWKIPSYDIYPVELDPKNEPSWLQHVPEKDRVGKAESWRG